MQTAKKLKFLATDPAEDVNMPQTKPVEKPVMTQDQILRLIGGIHDLQHHGTLKDAQGALRHASIRTTGMSTYRRSRRAS